MPARGFLAKFTAVRRGGIAAAASCGETKVFMRLCVPAYSSRRKSGACCRLYHVPYVRDHGREITLSTAMRTVTYIMIGTTMSIEIEHRDAADRCEFKAGTRSWKPVFPRSTGFMEISK
jgi:hypothetical protein